MCLCGTMFRSQILVHLKTAVSYQGVGVLVNISVSVMMRYRTFWWGKAWFVKAITLQTLNGTWTLCLNGSQCYMKPKPFNPGTSVPERGMREMPRRISGGRNATCKFTKDLFKVYKIMYHHPAFLLLTSNIAWTNYFNRRHFGTEFFYFAFFFLLHFIQAK